MSADGILAAALGQVRFHALSMRRWPRDDGVTPRDFDAFPTLVSLFEELGEISRETGDVWRERWERACTFDLASPSDVTSLAQGVAKQYEPGRLLRVIAVPAVEFPIEDRTFRPTVVELYEKVVAVAFRMTGEPDWDEKSPPPHRAWHTLLTLSDDRGTAYRCVRSGASSRGHGALTCGAVVFAPGASEAASLSLSVEGSSERVGISLS